MLLKNFRKFSVAENKFNVILVAVRHNSSSENVESILNIDDGFACRHIGPNAENEALMLKTVGYEVVAFLLSSLVIYSNCLFRRREL